MLPPAADKHRSAKLPQFRASEPDPVESLRGRAYLKRLPRVPGAGDAAKGKEPCQHLHLLGLARIAPPNRSPSRDPPPRRFFAWSSRASMT